MDFLDELDFAENEVNDVAPTTRRRKTLSPSRMKNFLEDLDDVDTADPMLLPDPPSNPRMPAAAAVESPWISCAGLSRSPALKGGRRSLGALSAADSNILTGGRGGRKSPGGCFKGDNNAKALHWKGKENSVSRERARSTNRRRSMVMPERAKRHMEEEEEESSQESAASEAKPMVSATDGYLQAPADLHGWRMADGDDVALLVRAFQAAQPGTPRARRIAARVFCLTGYPLVAEAASDAAALVEAAGGDMSWPVDSDEPLLGGKPELCQKKDQKRDLVLRLKPVFQMMEDVGRAEKAEMESALGLRTVKKRGGGEFTYVCTATDEQCEIGMFRYRYMTFIEQKRALAKRLITEVEARRRRASSSAPEHQEGRLEDTEGGRECGDPDGGSVLEGKGKAPLLLAVEPRASAMQAHAASIEAAEQALWATWEAALAAFHQKVAQENATLHHTLRKLDLS